MGGAASVLKNCDEQINRMGNGFRTRLKDDTLFFLHILWTRAPESFERLIQKLEQVPGMLKPLHIDLIAEIIRKQIELPENIVNTVQNYLSEFNDIDFFVCAMDEILVHYAPELQASAARNNLIHHDLPHALEISSRVSKLMNHLEILTGNDPFSKVLRAMIIVMIQFHDLEQRNTGEHHSVEEASAASVTGWIKTSLHVAIGSEFELLIDFIANRIIVLGTTMMFHPTRTMDLSELFLEFRQVAIDAKILPPYELKDNLPSKAGLMRYLDAIMLLTGVCDKNPSAVLELVSLQDSDVTISTLHVVKNYFQRPLLLEQFFTRGDFSNPYRSRSTDAIEHQAFLMSIIPHLCMRAEQSVANGEEDAKQFMQLISLCRKKRLKNLNPETFMQWFNLESFSLEMHRSVSAFFFKMIEHEIGFCKSQVQGLNFVSNALESIVALPNFLDVNQCLIDPGVPEKDADNLLALKNFYDKLNKSQQEDLICELFFAVMVQPGELNAVQMGLMEHDPESEITSPFLIRRYSNIQQFFPAVNNNEESVVDSDQSVFLSFG